VSKSTAVSLVLCLLAAVASADEVTITLFSGGGVDAFTVAAPGRSFADSTGRSMPAKRCEVRLTGLERGVSCAGKLMRQAPLVLEPGNNAPERFKLVVAGQTRWYTGRLRLTENDGRWQALLAAPFNDYLAGVVDAETNADEPAFLEAMVHAVRAHTLYRLRQGARTLADDTRAQQFRGLPETSRVEKLRALVNQTAGRRLRVEGREAPAFFHACCGGHTQAVARVWPELKTWMHLRGRCDTDDQGRAWCREDRWSAWRRELPVAAWRAFLTKHYSLGGVSRGGDEADFLGADGKVRRAWPFRMALVRELGWNTAPSDRFVIHDAGASVILEGRGFGHRVGLCQAGALAQAKAGRTAEQILRFYFPGATFE
jgi:stage II sporulation protein D (peptidoglycan lytic transglycosylase)